METHGRTPEDDEQAGARDSVESPPGPTEGGAGVSGSAQAVNPRPRSGIGDFPRNPQGYPPILGECLCGHQFRKHRTKGNRHLCLEFIGDDSLYEDERPCDCPLFEAAVR